jgi:hypothetical protein
MGFIAGIVSELTGFQVVSLQMPHFRQKLWYSSTLSHFRALPATDPTDQGLPP